MQLDSSFVPGWLTVGCTKASVSSAEARGGSRAAADVFERQQRQQRQQGQQQQMVATDSSVYRVEWRSKLSIYHMLFTRICLELQITQQRALADGTVSLRMVISHMELETPPSAVRDLWMKRLPTRRRQLVARALQVWLTSRLLVICLERWQTLLVSRD